MAVISPRSCGHCSWCVRGEDNNCIDSLRRAGLRHGRRPRPLHARAQRPGAGEAHDPRPCHGRSPDRRRGHQLPRRAAGPPPHPPGRHHGGDRRRGPGQLRHPVPGDCSPAPGSSPSIRSPPGSAYATELGAHVTMEGVTARHRRRHPRPHRRGRRRRVRLRGHRLHRRQPGCGSTRRGGAYALVGAGQGHLVDGVCLRHAARRTARSSPSRPPPSPTPSTCSPWPTPVASGSTSTSSPSTAWPRPTRPWRPAPCAAAPSSPPTDPPHLTPAGSPRTGFRNGLSQQGSSRSVAQSPSVDW